MFLRKWIFRRPPFMPLHVRRVRALAESAGGGTITTTPTPVSVVVSVVTPTTKKEITPTPVTVPVTVVTPTTTKTITPTPVSVVVSVVTPTTTKTITPTPVTIPIVVVTPTTTGGTGGGNINAFPSPVSVVVSVVTPTTLSTVTPTPVGVTVSVVTPTTTKTITPSPVSVVIVLPTPTTTGGTVVIVSPALPQQDDTPTSILGALYARLTVLETHAEWSSYFHLENTSLPRISIVNLSTTFLDLDSCHVRHEEGIYAFHVYSRTLEQCERLIMRIEDLYDYEPLSVKNQRIAGIHWEGTSIDEPEPGIFHGILTFNIHVERTLAV